MGLFDLFRKSSAKDDEPEDVAAGTDTVESDALTADAESVDPDLAVEPHAEDEASDDGPAADDATEDDDDDPFAPAVAADEVDDEWAPDAKEGPQDRAEKGPFDAAEDSGERNRLDLGALSVPVIDGMQIRLETEGKTDRVLGVTLVNGKAALQLQVFAAPRGEGLWRSVRTELAAGIRKRGGKADELYTDLGHELVSQVPVRTKDGRTGVRVTRFAGVDGPRWFLRAVFSGTAVTKAEERAALVDLFRGAVVDRGEGAMPPRELIALTPPEIPSTPGQAQGEQAQDGQQRTAAEPSSTDDLNPFERGPEIAETR